MNTNELTAKIRELKEYKSMVDELTQMIAAVEKDIKAEMEARNTDELTVDVYRVRWSEVESKRFDVAAFRKNMPILAEFYTKSSIAKRFSIA